MNDLPSYEAFAACLHTRFGVVGGNLSSLYLELVEVSDLQFGPHQQTFSLIFQGPANPFLPQQIVRLSHERLGQLDLFMVPTSRTTDAFLYEVVFNHLLESMNPGLSS